ncbi:MAG: DDE-type integrase/transposase/recombinase [Acidimicrobiales bacterium]
MPGRIWIGRDFTAEASNQRWVADITEFGCRDGKPYLAGVLDLHDRGLAGWSMATRATADIVVNALVMALARRQPDGEVIHHADRGGQYVSGDLVLTMADHDVTAVRAHRRAGITPRWNRRGRPSTRRSVTSTATGNR